MMPETQEALVNLAKDLLKTQKKLLATAEKQER
jgi:hypothetical protein